MAAAAVQAQPERLLGWMACLEDPTRLRLLRLLERNELQVQELCDVLQLPQSSVSRHLKVLADEGWVGSRAQANTRLYRMAETDAGARRLWHLAKEQMNGWATAAQDQLRLARRLADRQPAAQAFFAGAAGRWDRLRTVPNTCRLPRPNTSRRIATMRGHENSRPSVNSRKTTPSSANRCVVVDSGKRPSACGPSARPTVT